ncbi:MAG: peptidylprolyl isomerase [Candidatus Ozemobacteraceae bacterium]
MKKVAHGHKVAVHYTGTLANGEVFDSSEGRDPLKFTVGLGSVIDGFNDAVLGLTIGEERKVAVAPADGYGERDESRVLKIERDTMDADFTPEVGMPIGLEMQDGGRVRAMITGITEEELVLDLNHPLAGKTLNFAVQVLEIREADDPDAHGWEDEQHTHGCGSCGSCGDDEEGGCCGEHDHEGDCCGEHEHDGGCCGDHDCDEDDGEESDHEHEGSCCGRHK